MPIRVQIGVRDCGHWTAPYQTTIGLETLQSQAADCKSCAAILEWFLQAHASQSSAEAAQVAVSHAYKTSRQHSWGLRGYRFGISCFRGAWFTKKFIRDLVVTLLCCGLLALSIASPVMIGIAAVAFACLAGLTTVCCCGCGFWIWEVIKIGLKWFKASFLLSVGLILESLTKTLTSILRMLGANLSYEPWNPRYVALPAWSELDDEGYEDLESGMNLPFTKLTREWIPLAHPLFQFPRGSSCVRISSSAESPGSGCGINIYHHTYNPRGPVGSLVYFAPSIGQRENHPTDFLSLGGGKLFLSLWPREKQRWDTMRSRIGSSLAKIQGQEYAQITSIPKDLRAILNSSLPTRLLDLGQDISSVQNITVSALRSKLATATVKLITTPPNSRGRYLTLSHRWGDDEVFKLTKSSLSSFEHGIPFSSLGATFQDAIVVTKLLQHRYLWIDALCIVQDDEDDWERESSRMAAVYSNASCTISAHTAQDSNAGFLDASLEPPPTLVLRSSRYFFNPRRTITHLTLLGSFGDQVKRSFLSQRGWVFQERVLSRRLLHFVQHHTFFEDAAAVVSDDVVSADLPPLHRLEDNKWSVTDSCHGFVYWYRLVQNYSECSLTYEKDRLPAIAGLAQSFSEMNNPGRYMFGLWEKSLHIGLLWINGSGRPLGRRNRQIEAEDSQSDRLTLTSRVSIDPSQHPEPAAGEVRDEDEPSSATQEEETDKEGKTTMANNGTTCTDKSAPLMPSWSWAACRGAVVYPKTISDSMTSDIVLTGNSQSPQNGQLGVDTRPSLMVEGPLVHLTTALATRKQTDSPLHGLYTLTSERSQFGTWVSLDHEAASESVVFPKLSCLRLCSLREADNSFVLRYETMFYFLLLEEIDGSESGRYQRLGVGVTSQDHWKGVKRSEVEIA